MSQNILNKNQVEKVSVNIIKESVEIALREDIGSGDITAELVEDIDTSAFCITRSDMILCGQDFVNEVLKQVDSNIKIHWHFKDGSKVAAGSKIFELSGNARSILTAERSALNFLQMLSATATETFILQSLISNYKTKLLDTRKTIPGFRMAQKYAVRCGGGYNHRIGLFDAYLIKENHIRSAGGIEKAIAKARKLNESKMVEVEVTNFEELDQAIATKADIVMLDNFSLKNIEEAVELAKNNVLLEVSGNVDEETIVDIAKTGVDFISVGAITKNIKAIDLSMQIEL
ncbi:carboxylating nicotinate-nucleotide diphosphorylase [Francisella frigiditurris]|uniref:Probable nicotinate-nucleotide pyrophosphorylase [carboxylating] n=1 Tax=Francisella frigiditurris TaxID=1542390 RepID=A0A1J0KTS0_9GAMM|nr:carboxylating nicotinate-nucleotide diphosphorylase [Francisella frigiditurris]APC97083.1 nicotinate-nucleotide diphosphorylase [Francisella frigiditurris]